MQQDFTYIERGARFSIKLWSDHNEAAEQATALRQRTKVPHEIRQVGDFGWLCYQQQPSEMWFDATSLVVVQPQDLLNFLRLRQSALDSKAYLELDRKEALEQVGNSWLRMNPLDLGAPKAADYGEASLLTVFMLDQPNPEIPLEEGVRMIYEQSFCKRAPQGYPQAISQRLSNWWAKTLQA